MPRKALDLLVDALLVLAVVGFMAWPVFAQEVPPPVPTPPDWINLAVAAVNALGIIAVPIFVWLTKRLLPKIPKFTLPIIALVVGVVINYVAGVLTGGHISLIQGAFLGAAGVWLREILHTLQEHGAQA